MKIECLAFTRVPGENVRYTVLIGRQEIDAKHVITHALASGAKP